MFAEIRKQSQETEELQENYRMGRHFLKDRLEIFSQLFRYEQRQNESLSDYHVADGQVYASVHTVQQQHARRLLEAVDDQLREVCRKERALEEVREQLLMEERKLLEEEQAHGQNGDW